MREPGEMTRKLRAADEQMRDQGMFAASLQLTLGYLLGAEMYGGAAAVAKAMAYSGVPVAPLFEAILRGQ